MDERVRYPSGDHCDRRGEKREKTSEKVELEEELLQ